MKSQRMTFLNRALGGVGALSLSVYCEDVTDTTDPTDADSTTFQTQAKFKFSRNEMLSYCACAILGSGRRAESCGAALAESQTKDSIAKSTLLNR